MTGSAEFRGACAKVFDKVKESCLFNRVVCQIDGTIRCIENFQIRILRDILRGIHIVT